MTDEPNVHPAAYMSLDADRGRAELWDTRDGQDTFIGFIGYRVEPGAGEEIYVIQHTIVDSRFSRQGYARCLVSLFLEHIKQTGGRFSSQCSYVDDFLRRYPEYLHAEYSPRTA